jgi:hypothetical protein
MEQAEVHDDRVETGRVERQRFRVALAKHHRRMPPRCLGNHRRREVEADHIGTTRGRGGGDRPRTGRDVEDAAARRHIGRVEERTSGLRGQRAKRIFVMR